MVEAATECTLIEGLARPHGELRLLLNFDLREIPHIG
jgi:hypothetical protein